jgi:hypothetical protein
MKVDELNEIRPDQSKMTYAKSNKSRRIIELARELEVKSSAILDKLRELGISGKTHSSSVEEDVVLQLRHVFLGEDLPAGTLLGSSPSANNGAAHGHHETGEHDEPRQHFRPAPGQPQRRRGPKPDDLPRPGRTGAPLMPPVSAPFWKQKPETTVEAAVCAIDSVWPRQSGESDP